MRHGISRYVAIPRGTSPFTGKSYCKVATRPSEPSRQSLPEPSHLVRNLAVVVAVARAPQAIKVSRIEVDACHAASHAVGTAAVASQRTRQRGWPAVLPRPGALARRTPRATPIRRAFYRLPSLRGRDPSLLRHRARTPSIERLQQLGLREHPVVVQVDPLKRLRGWQSGSQVRRPTGLAGRCRAREGSSRAP